MKKANPQVQNPDRIYSGQTLNLPSETSPQGYTNHHSTGEYGPPLPPDYKPTTSSGSCPGDGAGACSDQSNRQEAPLTSLSREQLLAYLDNVDTAPDSTETSGTNPRIQKQMDDWVKEFTAALEKSEDVNIVIKQHNQYYIFDKNMLKGAIILGKDKFAQAFPNAYEQMASWEDAASGFVAGVVDKADKGIHRVFGEGYENSKKWIGNFLSEVNEYAPEIARDGVLLFGGSAAATKIFGKVDANVKHTTQTHTDTGDFGKKVEIDLSKVIISKNNLGTIELANLKRFEKKLPSSDRTIIERLANGNTVFRAEVYGNVPGSKAVYEKTINSQGKTIQYYKTTYAPDGHIVHVKNKFNKIREE